MRGKPLRALCSDILGFSARVVIGRMACYRATLGTKSGAYGIDVSSQRPRVHRAELIARLIPDDRTARIATPSTGPPLYNEADSRHASDVRHSPSACTRSPPKSAAAGWAKSTVPTTPRWTRCRPKCACQWPRGSAGPKYARRRPRAAPIKPSNHELTCAIHCCQFGKAPG